ncbi:MAG: DUF2798 domain-containing protein [Campylobacterales bacterium]|nr:DUF2798 domain-containing protein [Campylobacterales bacterium]
MIPKKYEQILFAFFIAFPTILLIGPLVRRSINLLVGKET